MRPRYRQRLQVFAGAARSVGSSRGLALASATVHLRKAVHVQRQVKIVCAIVAYVAVTVHRLAPLSRP